MTTIFITHDQSEAMILSDRVVVMNAGRIVQEGTPQAIYRRPSTQFVMEFLGQVDQLDRPRGALASRRAAAGAGARAAGDIAVPLSTTRTPGGTTTKSS